MGPVGDLRNLSRLLPRHLHEYRRVVDVRIGHVYTEIDVAAPPPPRPNHHNSAPSHIGVIVDPPDDAAERFLDLRGIDGAVPGRIDVEEVADRRCNAAADRPGRPEEDPFPRNVFRNRHRSRRTGESHRPALEEVDPHLSPGVYRGGEFGIERLSVSLLQPPEHLPDQPDEVGPGQEMVEGEDELLRRRLEAPCPRIRRVSVPHQRDEEIEVRVIPPLQDLHQRPGCEFVTFQIDEVHLPLGVLGDPPSGFGAKPGVAHGNHPGVVIPDPVHRPCTQTEDETDHPLRGVDPVRPGVEVPGKGDAGKAREEVLFTGRPGDALDQDRHLLVALAQPPGAAVGQRVRVQGARVDQLHGAQKRLQPLLRRPLVRAVFAAVLPGECVAEAVLQQTARTGDDRRLAEVGKHVPELLQDLRRKLPGKETLLHIGELLVGDARGAGELEAQAEEVVVHQEGEKDIRADVE